jgi:hypothetical protein
MIENGNIAYSMPKEIKEQLTDSFLGTFVSEIHKIFGFSIQTFANEEIWYQESTGGWYEAFANTCRKLNKEQLLLYYLELEWYDSDVFDGKLTDILIERKFILPSVETNNFYDLIAKENNLKKEDIFFCSMCENAFHKQYMKVYIYGIDDNEEDKVVVCPHCYELSQNIQNGGKTEPEIFEQEVPKIQPLFINRKNIIIQNLRYSDLSLFECPKCKKYHLVENRTSLGNCYYCELSTNAQSEPQANSYYKESCELNKQYVEILKEKYSKN